MLQFVQDDDDDDDEDDDDDDNVDLLLVVSLVNMLLSIFVNSPRNIKWLP
jgi:hypothetical protein